MGKVKFTNTELPDIVELKNISQSYDGGNTWIIKDLDFLIEDKPDQGQFVAILGTSGCVDADTEFFTGFGWKKIKDYKDSDKVLQYLPNGDSELVKPNKYLKIKSDQLNYFKTKYGISQAICNDHRIIYVNRKNRNKLLEIKCSDMIKKHEENINGFSGNFITAFKYKGKGLNLSEAEIRLMIAVIADGSFISDSPKNNRCRVNLKKEKKIERLEYLLKLNNIRYIRRDNQQGYTIFTFKAPRKEKYFTNDWYNFNEDQSKVIQDEIFRWDGNNKNVFTTNIKESADFIQFVFSSNNLRASINIDDRVGKIYQQKYVRKSITYRVIVSKNKYVSILNPNKTEIKKVNTIDGYKYCFTVDSGMLILRKDNCIFITGNCGKSTILRHICGLQEPTEGKVLIKAIERNQSHRIGMVFQRYSCLPWYTVLQNIELGLRYQGLDFNTRRKEARKLIDLVGLTGHEDKYAEYPALSGGQLQRVAIAMNLAIKPEILVMDEPFGALDIKTRLDMQDLLNSIWRELKTTIIFVTHDISEAVYLAEDIYVMASNPGRFVEHYKIELPLHRERSLKRDKKFNDLVFTIEDKMMELQNGKN